MYHNRWNTFGFQRKVALFQDIFSARIGNSYFFDSNAFSTADKKVSSFWKSFKVIIDNAGKKIEICMKMNYKSN